MLSYVTVGALIREARERQGYSQEEVCHGICTASTLSRIENGQQAPGKKILESLLQRLGIENQACDIVPSRREGERYEMEQNLIRCLARKEYAKAQKIADFLEELLKKETGREYSAPLERQYLCFAKVIIQKSRGENTETILQQLLQIIRMTMPKFDGVHIQSSLLTFHEISILNMIGCSYHAMGNLWDALRLMFDLKEYMEKHVLNGQEISEKYPMVLFNLSSWLGQEGYCNDALKLCQKGIDFCIEHGKMHAFPMLLCNKACALAELGRIECCKEFFLQSIAVFQAIGQHEYAERTRKYAKAYGISLK